MMYQHGQQQAMRPQQPVTAAQPSVRPEKSLVACFMQAVLQLLLAQHSGMDNEPGHQIYTLPDLDCRITGQSGYYLLDLN